ncbi:MAG: hypothetical protein JWQ95_2104 [Sphaerisporangium sp.]|nr:hypothetical protein [Sphaerisporangium sp.]
MPTRGGTPGSADSDQLSRFVRDYLAAHDIKVRALARRAIDPETGFELQHGWINELAAGRVSRAPELWRLRALAAAMGARPRILAELAAAQWLGVQVAEVSRDDGKKIGVSIPENLPPEKVDEFIRIAEDIARQMGA